jgi:TonB family protein
MSLSLHRLAFVLVASASAPLAAQAAPADAAPSERAQRDADRVRQMILLHADKPRRARVDERAAAPVAVTRPAPAVEAPAAVPPAVAALVAGSAAPVARPALPELAPTPTVVAAPMPASLASVRTNRLELIRAVEPAFPRRLAQSVTSGSITLAFDVLPDGSVAAVKVLRSPHPGLDAAAITAVSQWRFQPIAERAGGVTEFAFE